MRGPLNLVFESDDLCITVLNLVTTCSSLGVKSCVWIYNTHTHSHTQQRISGSYLVLLTHSKHVHLIKDSFYFERGGYATFYMALAFAE